jgi:hypothetical protein
LDSSNSSSHSSLRVTYEPIQEAYENSPNAAESSGRGGGDAIGLGPETLRQTAFQSKRLGDTIVPEHSERFGKWIFL